MANDMTAAMTPREENSAARRRDMERRTVCATWDGHPIGTCWTCDARRNSALASAFIERVRSEAPRPRARTDFSPFNVFDKEF